MADVKVLTDTVVVNVSGMNNAESELRDVPGASGLKWSLHVYPKGISKTSSYIEVNVRVVGGHAIVNATIDTYDSWDDQNVKRTFEHKLDDEEEGGCNNFCSNEGLQQGSSYSISCTATFKPQPRKLVPLMLHELIDDSKPYCTDAKIVIGKSGIKVHRGFLSMISPVFTAMFNPETKESKTSVINITDFSVDTVRHALDYCYGADVVDLTAAEVVDMLRFYDKYDIQPAMAKLDAWLNAHLTVKNFAAIATYACTQASRFQAVNDLFSSVGHSSKSCGCLRCLVLPERLDKKSCWPTIREEPDRTPESYFEDAVNRQNGLKGPTEWYRIQNPSEWRVEALHVIDKGFIMVYKGIYLKTKSQIRKWNRVFITGRYPDSTVFRPRTLVQTKRFTANDNRTVFFTLMPIIWLASLGKSPVKSALAFLSYLCVRHMASRRLNVAAIETIVQSMEYVGANINTVFPNKFRQMKAHLLFVHGVDDLLERGTPFDHTAAPFEAMNRIIKVRFHPYDTRSLTGSILINFLAYREWIRKAHQYLEDEHVNENFAKALQKLMPKDRVQKQRFSAVKEGGLFDNSVIRFRQAENLRYGRIVDIHPEGMLLVEPYVTKPLLEYFLAIESLPSDLTANLNLFKHIESLCDKVLDLEESLFIGERDIVDVCCSLKYNGDTYVFDLTYRGPNK